MSKGDPLSQLQADCQSLIAAAQQFSSDTATNTTAQAAAAAALAAVNNDLAAIQQDQAAVAADIQALVNPTPAPSKSCRTVLFDAAKRIAAYREGVAALDKKYNLGGQLWAIHVAAIAGLAQLGASSGPATVAELFDNAAAGRGVGTINWQALLNELLPLVLSLSSGCTTPTITGS